MSELCFVSWDGDHIGQQVGKAVLRDEPEEVSRLSHAIEQGNRVFASWITEHRGSLISCGGDEGAGTIPADRLGDLPDLMSRYESAVGAPVSVGVGARMSESAKALLVAKRHGGDQVHVYDEQTEAELKDIQAPTEDEKLRDHYGAALGKTTDAGGYDAAPSALAGGAALQSEDLSRRRSRGRTEPLEKMALIHNSSSQPRTVYRIQNAQGQGPYASGDISPEEGDELETPTAEHDFKPNELREMDRHGLLFGFKTPDEASGWFGKDQIQHLYGAGFRLKAVPASKVYDSKSGLQVLFQAHPSHDPAFAPDAPTGAFFRHPDVKPTGVRKVAPAPALPVPKTKRVKKAEGESAPADPVLRQPLVPPADPAAAGPSLPMSVADLAPVRVTLQDRVRGVVRAGLDADRARLAQDDTVAQEVRGRLAEVLQRVGGSREELEMLVQHAPGVADVLADLVAAVRALGRTLPRTAEAPEGGEPVEKAGAGSEVGREHVVLPTGAIRGGRVKVSLSSTGGEGYRQVRSGMVSAPDGTPTSAAHPNPATGQLR